MIVYRQHKRTVRTLEALDRLRECSDEVEWRIRFGELESGVADALCPHTDEDLYTLASMRHAGILRNVEAAPRGDLPETIEAGVQEGFAYYGLDLDSYAASTREMLRHTDGREFVVIGIRTIGAALSSEVAAELEANGCTIWSFTVRPHGHPFDRYVSLGESLRRTVRELQAWNFVIVDEGPGLSGSSMTSVARGLAELGVAEDRIFLMPSWEGDESAFRNEAARAQWPKHLKFPGSYKQPPERSWDLSAGKWRELLFQEQDYPAVQRQHERIKYLVATYLYKFAGLGPYGIPFCDRAREIGEAGFSPPALALEDGFLITRFIDGRPLTEGDVCPQLVQRMSAYLEYRRDQHPGNRAVPWDELREMIRVNAGEQIEVERFRTAVCDAPTTAIDARMLPHEWIVTADGYLKTDAVDHHDDHFFPGDQDIAWDVAGAAIEFGVDPALLLSGGGIAHRLPFYRLAYAAYRLGYCTMAAETLGESPDGRRFTALAERYRREIWKTHVRQSA